MSAELNTSLDGLKTAYDLFNLKKYKACFLNLISLSSQWSHQADFLRLLSDVQIRLGDVVSAGKTLNVLRKQTNSFEDNMNYAQNQIQLGHSHEATGVLKELLSSTETLFRKHFIQKTLLGIYIAHNDIKEILPILSFYDEHSLQDDMSLYARAFLCLNEDRKEEALAFLRKSVQLNPSNDKCWVTLAMLHYQMGDHDLALGNIEKALDINKYNATAVKCYAQWKQNIGQNESARQKINFYLSQFNFDEEMTRKHIDVLQKTGHIAEADTEALKLKYYFGLVA